MCVSNIQIPSVGLGNAEHENFQLTQQKMISMEGGKTGYTQDTDIIFKSGAH